MQYRYTPRHADRLSKVSRGVLALLACWALLGLTPPKAEAGGQGQPTTTIITHGYLLDFGGDPPAVPGWALTMAEKLLHRADFEGAELGSAFQYQPQTGKWTQVWGSGTNIAGRPIVLLLDWAEDSNELDWLIPQAAADAFYAALREPLGALQGVSLLGGRTVHLIGHSRGASVNSELARRICAAGFTIDQVTTLDPHPVVGAEPNCFYSGFNLGDPTPVAWQGITWTDNYFRDDLDGWLICDPNGISLDCHHECELDEWTLNGVGDGYDGEHSDVHLWYLATIDHLATEVCEQDGECIDEGELVKWFAGMGGPPCFGDRATTGYYYSSVGDGAGSRPTSAVTQTDPGSPPVIHGGTFDGMVGGSSVPCRGGWIFHGGTTAWGALVQDGSGYHFRMSTNADGNGGYAQLDHNRFYLPAGEATLSAAYSWSSSALPTHEITVELLNLDGIATWGEDVAVNTTAESFTIQIPPSFGGHTYELRIHFTTGSSIATLRLDNIAIDVTPPPPPPSGAVQWTVAEGGNGHWYKLDPVLRAWDDARVHAESMGGHLATFPTQDEQGFISSVWLINQPTDDAYVGALQPLDSPEPNGNWGWVTGEAWGTPWAIFDDAPCGVDTGPNQQNVGHLGSGAVGDIERYPNTGCTSGPRSSMVEWSADCNDDGIVDYGQILSGQLADADGNGVPDCCAETVGGDDLAFLLGAWGSDDPDADIDGDGMVKGADLAILLANWGGPPFWGGCQPSAPAWATVIEQAPNSAVVYDAGLRQKILATGLPWRVKDTATQIEFVLIPPGTFDMGCSASLFSGCEYNENPVHSVTLTQPFYMSRYEITQAQWQSVTGSNPSYFGGDPSRPVESVSWNTTQGFLSATGFRLPTEAEWEYAYRAGTTTAFHGWPAMPAGTSVDSQLGPIAWYFNNSSSQTRPVGLKAANGFGLHDMAGNVWEWVSDWWDWYPSEAQTDPQGPLSGSYRLFRGGGWANASFHCRASVRAGFYPPSTTGFDLGFRAARTP